MLPEQQSYATQPMSAGEQAQLARKHIFCVNGDPSFLDLLRVLFQDERYNVTTTNFVHGTFAQIAAAQPDVLLVDLVIMQQAGWDLLVELAASAGTQAIPVVITSTDQRLLDEASADLGRYGGRAHIVQPFDLHMLLETVARLIGRA